MQGPERGTSPTGTMRPMGREKPGRWHLASVLKSSKLLSSGFEVDPRVVVVRSGMKLMKTSLSPAVDLASSPLGVSNRKGA